MNSFRGGRSRVAVLVAVVAAALAGGIAYASIPDSQGVIHACYRQDGDSRFKLIDTSQNCGAGWTAINFNQKGPVGASGETGPSGQQGPSGPGGPSGASGPSGAAGPAAGAAVFTAPGAYTYAVPAGVTWVEVDAWGSGAAGESGLGGQGGGGGGGGAVTTGLLPVSGCSSVSVAVGPGGPALNGDGAESNASCNGDIVRAGGGRRFPFGGTGGSGSYAGNAVGLVNEPGAGGHANNGVNGGGGGANGAGSGAGAGSTGDPDCFGRSGGIGGGGGGGQAQCQGGTGGDGMVIIRVIG